MPGGRGWVREDVPQTPGGTYVFGGVASPSSSRSPSFLRKKNKMAPSEFPPTSWGEQTTTGSYFSDSASRQAHSRNITWDGGNSRKFDTDFESDFSPSLLPKSQRMSDEYDNPFTPTSKPSYGSKPMMPQPRADFQFDPPASSHSRALSLDQYNSPSLNNQYSNTNSFYSSTTSPPQSKMSPATASVIKTREELARPLLPQEGVARGIALYDFHAVEVS